MGAEETNNQSTKEPVEISDLERKIIRQVEYYFGNYNLSKDKFLREQIQLDDGWINLETMVKFNRLKMLSEDFAVIAEALKKSPNHLMEVNEDGTKIRRSLESPLPDSSKQLREEIDGRSVYVKGFKPDTTLDELLDFFKQYNNPENILMRRKKPTKKFKGSVFVTFLTKEDAEKFLETSVKFKGTDLLKEPKIAYVERKNIQYEQIRKEIEEKKKKKAEEKKGDNKAEGGEEEKEDPNITKGCLLKLTDLPPNTMREHIKETLESYEPIAYIDFRKGLTTAVVRFESPVALEVLEKASVKQEDGTRKIKICDEQVPIFCLEGEEEVEYWKTIATSKSAMKERRGWQNRQKGGKGRFGKRRKRNDKNDSKDNEDAGEQPTKKIKSEKSNENNESVKETVAEITEKNNMES